MESVGRSNFASRLIDWVGALGFGVGVGFAAFLLSTDIVALLMTVAATIVGHVVMARSANPVPAPAFVPVPIEIDGASFAPATSAGLKHVVIGGAREVEEEPYDLTDVPDISALPISRPLADADGDDLLILDDPLVPVQDNDRVVRLFAPVAHHPAAMVARIEDYLHRAGQSASTEAVNGPDTPRAEPLPDAAEALHSALANIRASLR